MANMTSHVSKIKIFDKYVALEMWKIEGQWVRHLFCGTIKLKIIWIASNRFLFFLGSLTALVFISEEKYLNSFFF